MTELPAECDNCHVTGPTQDWYGDSSAMGWLHTSPRQWCRRCILRAQIDFAESIAARIPNLRSELAGLDRASPNAGLVLSARIFDALRRSVRLPKDAHDRYQ